MDILDYIGMGSVLVIVVIIGFISMSKISGAQDFLLAGKGLSRKQATLSLIASEFGGGGLVGATAAIYTMGIAGVWWNWSAVIPFILVGIYVAPRLRELELVTVPEYFEKRYDKKSRLFSTIMQIVATVPGITAQLTVAAVAIVTVTGWNYTLALGIVTMFVILYTVSGGLVADVANDNFLFFVIIISLIFTLGFSTIEVGGISSLVSRVPEGFLDLGHIGFWEPFSWVLLCLFDYATSQYIVQRAFSARDPKTAGFAFVFTGIAFIFMGGAVALIGLNAFALMPGMDDPNQSYAMLAGTFLPKGFAGIALGGIVAAALSTVDSSLMSTSTLFVNDIYKTYLHKKSSDKEDLLVSRIVIIAATLLSIVIANYMNNIIDLIYISGLFYGAAVFFPLILGMFNKNISSHAGFAAMVAAVAAGVISEFFLCGKVAGIMGVIPSNLLSAAASFVVLVVISIMSKPGEPSARKNFKLRSAFHEKG